MSIEARFRIVRDNFTLDVDLAMPADGITSLFGPSGSGKTTLLRAIAGLERHEGSFLRVNGETWQDGDRFLPPHRRPIGYVFQEPSLFPHLSVMGNLKYGEKRIAADERAISLEQAIELLGIGDLLHRKPIALSGGERQRVAIARALAVSPKLLLMDEPLAALDEKRKADILPYIEALQSGLELPIIHVSHDSGEVARLADHVVLMDSGRAVASGTAQDLFTRLDLQISHESDAATVIDASVEAHDSEYHLSRLRFSGGQIQVPQTSLPIGSHVRIRLAARDVSLTLKHQHETSILNVFPALIDQVGEEDGALVIVRLVAGNERILSRITRKSCTELDLAAGKQVYAQVKSVALLNPR